VPADQIKARLRKDCKGGRPPGLDCEAYKQRNTVERAINKLRQHRAVTTRYDKRDFAYRGTVDAAASRIWLRDPSQDLRGTRPRWLVFFARGGPLSRLIIPGESA